MDPADPGWSSWCDPSSLFSSPADLAGPDVAVQVWAVGELRLAVLAAVEGGPGVDLQHVPPEQPLLHES